ncbi:putative ferric reductase transmembrane component [Triangularia verruculosa]|uniref:Ferric reductase transmembrane component n=1 Tax=Triangularia verruculosa TaxID=2587418 RepID=A0AAN7AW89_9PEZI|nr:putative ferric reductase transmembrane component [Triangularia verruculosa]
MRASPILWLATCLLQAQLAISELVGFGLHPFKIYCASACHWALQSYPLECSAKAPKGFGGWVATSSPCKANDTAYLTTLAWCIHVKCGESRRMSELQSFWETDATRDMIDFKNRSPPVPAKWSYEESLQQIVTPPTEEPANTSTVLDFTALVPEDEYQSQFNTAWGVTNEQELGANYGVIILVTGFGIPIILTWLYHLPFTSRLLAKITPYLVHPSTIGTYSVRPLPFLLGNAPTIGQTAYIVIFFIINIVLMSVNYQSMQPHLYYIGESMEIKAYIFYRTGIAAYALLPLLILFASRNNVLLLWLTNWSHSTYLLLHRWVARLFVLHALVHSFLALPIFLPQKAVVDSDYWAWGVVATILCVVILFASVLPIRIWSYEIFLISHVVLSVILVVGLWYHVVLWIGLDTYGYETWIYAACAVWFFDRAARVGRVLKNGIRRSKVTDLGNGYIRVDVPRVSFANDGPGLHVYAYFPTLSLWRPWENHPFSIVPTSMMLGQKPIHRRRSENSSGNSSPTAKESGINIGVKDVEKHQGFIAAQSLPKSSGITLLIKKSTGITNYLQANGGLLTLMDGPYHNTSTREIRHCDRLLLIGGGIGITSLLPWIASHPNVKVFWSVKESAKCLVDEVEGVLSGVEKDTRVGSRLDITGLLEQEAELGYSKIGVVVSGPGGLCDDVRAAVVATAKASGTVFELDVDAYSW